MAVIVKKAVKDLVRRSHNVGEDFLKRLDAEVTAMIKRAAERARANRRKTLKARDV